MHINRLKNNLSLLYFLAGAACSAFTFFILERLDADFGFLISESFLSGFLLALVVSLVMWIVENQMFQSKLHRTDFEVQGPHHSGDLAKDSTNTTNRTMMAVTVGEELFFESIDRALLNLLGYPSQHPGPQSVYDLLPSNMSSHHRRWVGEMVRSGKLPARLQHPLRNVQVRNFKGTLIRMDLNIDKKPETKSPCFELTFAACPETVETVQRQINVGEQTEYPEAYVMLLDIMEFTKACSQLTAVEVLHWMRCVRKAVEDLLLEHNMKLIETRGDNYLAITTSEDGPEPAVRAVSFACRAARAVCALQDTRIRVGLARGPVTVARLQCMDQREVLCVFGDVVNVAGRLEQSGDAACIHMSEAVAERYAADRGLPPPPVRTIVAKGKPEGIRSACWNWRADAFDTFEQPPP